MTELQIKIDFSNKGTEIKPLNGVCSIPIIGADLTLLDKLSGIGVPYIYLSSVCGNAYGKSIFDVDSIFKDLNADENDPDSYDFSYADYVLDSICEKNIKVIYCLKNSVSDLDRCVKGKKASPPSDYSKWARVCEHIIKHFNCGWANGKHYGIRYFEVWESPDLIEDRSGNAHWGGSPEEYYELYRITSCHLKNAFPDISIGGYSASVFGSADASESAASENDKAYRLDFFEGFLEYMGKHKDGMPIDFFSWQLNTGIENACIASDYYSRMLACCGKSDIEHIVTYACPEGTAAGSLSSSAETCAMMIALQNSRVDIACMLNSAFCSPVSSLFDLLTQKPYKAFYALSAFNIIRDLRYSYPALMNEPDNIKMFDDLYRPSGAYVLASGNEDASRKAVLYVNTKKKPISVNVPTGDWVLYSLDKRFDLSPTKNLHSGDTVLLPETSVSLILFHKTAD